MKPGDRVRMKDGPHRGDLMWVIRECDGGGLWDVAPFPSGRGGIYVRPHEVEVIEGLGPVDYATTELRVAAQMGLRPDQRDIHQATAEALGCSRAEAKVASFKVLYGRGSK